MAAPVNSSHVRRTARGWLRAGIVASAAGLGIALVAPATPASAGNVAQNSVVSANPANWTPDVVSGSVQSLAQAGGTMVAGGTFSQVRNHGESNAVTRNNLFSFDASNGRVTSNFQPNLNGMVRAVAASGSGDSVFVGGDFKQVNGVSRISLVKLSLADGSIVQQFSPPRLDGRVFSMALANGRLLVAGSFTHVGARAIDLIASLDPVTGAVDPSFHASFAGTNNPNSPGFRVIRQIAVSPSGNRLVAVGNFMQVNGADRGQIALFTVSGSSLGLANWQTNRYRQPCDASFDTYMRDVDFAPDGSYFAVVTSGGGYDGHDQSIGCDSAARWQTDATGSNLQPRWITFTGNDSLQSVAVSGAAVYTGGHNRWINNPYGSDFAGPGAVSRPGLSALDPQNGNAFSWNPTRTLGVGVFDMVVTPAGLWIGHDTNTVGHETHNKLAFFPLA